TTPVPADSRIDVQKPNGTRMRFIDTKTATQHELVVDGILPEVRYRVAVSSQTGAGLIWKTVAECLLTTEVVLDQFIEAETMPTKTVGRAESPGWNLDAKGFLAMPVNFPQAGAYRFEILSRGEYRNKIWPQLALSIDNGKPDTLTINSAVFRLFQRARQITAGPHTVALAFANPSDGRQLIVDQLHVQFIGTPATPPPAIAGLAVANLTTSAATINWKTATPTEAQIEYGAGTNYGLLTPLDFCRDTTHVFTLSGLAHNTTYHFRVRARDAAGKLAASRDTTFTTLADRQPPLISNIAVPKRTATSATITWSTDEPGTSQVEFGLTASYGHVSALNPALIKQHEVTLLNLASSTTFHARVKSTDAVGNVALSQNFTFTTLPAVERLAKISGDSQAGKPQKLLAAPLVVKVLDATGAGMSNISVAFRVSSGGGKIINANTCDSAACIITTKADGTAAANWELGKTDAQIVEANVVDRPDLAVRFTAQVDLTGVPSEDDQTLPTAFSLRHHPNPFRETAQFEIALPAPGQISLKIFDVQGREVVALFEGAKTAGRFLMNWNGRDQLSREIAAGIYFAVLRYEIIASSGAAQILTEKRQVVYLK
ncbi:MAG: fibronectin type III domain-containing protein, partial [bacterium]